MPVAVRTADLLSRISLEDKVGFMLISTTRLKNDWSLGAPQNKNAVTSDTTTDALLDVITGQFDPSGKMPFSTPRSEAAAQNQKTDVPGYLEGPNYALFKYDEGLRYK